MSDLLERICSEENLQLAFQRACYLRNQEKRQGFLNPFENQYIQHDKEILLAQSQTAILSGSYAPAAARIYYTPKGKYAHRKRLSCNLVDLVVKIAVLNIIGPVVDKKFLDCCYANRLSNPQDQLKWLFLDWKERYLKFTSFVVREYHKGHKWELKTDISNFYYDIDHDLLLERFIQLGEIQDEDVIGLVKNLLTIPEVGYSHSAEKIKDYGALSRGIPVGNDVEGFLGNVYLHEIDDFMTKRGLAYGRYVDDIRVFAATKSDIFSAWRVLEEELNQLRLHINATKTEIKEVSDPYAEVRSVGDYGGDEILEGEIESPIDKPLISLSDVLLGDRDSYIEDLKNAATWADSEPVKKAILYFLQEPETQILSFLPDVIQNHPRCINMSFSLMNKIGLESLSITAQLLKHPDTEEYIQYRCCRLAAEIGSEFPPTSDITEWFSEHILPLAHSKHWFVQLAALYALNVIKHDALDDIIRDILLNSEELDELVVCAAISLCGEIEQIHHTICECPKKNMVESAFSALDLGSLTSTQRQALVHVASEQDAILFLARAYYHSSDPKHLIDLAKLESSVGHKPYKQYIRTLFERWYKKEELLQNPNVLIQLVVKLLEPKDLNRTLLIAISQMLYQVKRTGGDKNEIELLESQIRERLISDVIEELPHSQVEYPEMGSRTWFDDSGGYFYHSTAQDGRRLIVQRVDITNRDKLLSIKKSGLLEKLDDGFCSFAVEPSQRENWIEIVYEIPDGYQLLDSYLRGTEPTPSNYLSERTIVRWLKQMCSIVKAFHAHGLVLGGINLGHLVIDKTTENLKVFNFVLNPVQHPFQSARVHWGSKAQDIYSLGVVLYALATLEIPQNYWENPHDEPDWLAPKYEKNLAYHIYPSGFYQLTSKTTGYDCTKLSIEKVLKMVERLEEDIHSIEKSAEGLDFADTIPKREVEFLKLLIDFKENFNQNQGYMKFWDGGKGNRLKSNPHQIADGFMRKYFEKLSRDIQGFKFKEGEKAGVGECDFLVEWDNLKYIIELEVCGPRYPDNDETAIGQVEEYMKKHNSDVSFIIVFDAIDRESEKRIRSFQKHDRHYHFEYLALNPITPSEAGNAPVYSEK